MQDLPLAKAGDCTDKLVAVTRELRDHYRPLMARADKQRSTLRELTDRNGEDQWHLREEISSTLVTKILTGTLSCIPAFDTEFNAGIRYHQGIWPRLSEGRLKILFNKLSTHKAALDDIRKEFEYPEMRLVDWAYWLLGAQLTDDQQASIRPPKNKP